MANLEFKELNAQELESVNGGEFTIIKWKDGRHLYILGFEILNSSESL